MYLTQVILKVHDSYEQHQAVWSLFPNAPKMKRDHLFRVEETARTNCKLLLQSSTKPTSSDSAEVVAVKEFTPKVMLDAYYKFKIVAYPTKRLGETKKVIELSEANDQAAWLQRKLAGATTTITSMDSYLVQSKKTATSRFVCFEGILQVTDAEQIERALVMGIGRKKHAGAGLLSLARTQ